MSLAAARMPSQDGLQMQPVEVGLMQEDKQQKTMAQSTRKGSKKEKGCTPVVMGSHPMAKERAEKGAPAVAGSRVITGRESDLWSTRGGGE